MKTAIRFLSFAAVLSSSLFGALEEDKAKPSVVEMLKVKGSYEYNLVGKRLTRTIDPVLLKRLSEHPEEDEKENYILAEWIVKAGVEKRKEFQYLLEVEVLRKIPRYESALLAYDYNMNGNQKALDKLLAQLRKDVKTKDAWNSVSWGLGSLVGLSGVNEWESTKDVLGSVKLSTDGSSGDERYGFWLARRYYFPADTKFPVDYDEFCREMNELQSQAKKAEE